MIELASVLAGPSVGQFFAELGAEVIKIENKKTRGDVTRKWLVNGEQPSGGLSAYFSSANWGKKSIALDLSSQSGKEIVHELVGQTDILISSYKVGDDIKLGVDYESIKKDNPKLIYGHITGYGRENPRTGYDAIIQAEAGFMYMNGEPNGEPLKMPVALIDILAAHHLKEGLLLALLARATTGKGDYVHVSLFDAALASLANQAGNWLVAGNIPEKMGQEHPNIVPYGKVFNTVDDQKIILAVGTDEQFQRLCEILGKSEIALDQKFSKNERRVQNREALNDILSLEISQQQSHDFLSKLKQLSIPCGVINRMDQVFALAQSKSMLNNATDGSEKKGVRNLAFSLGKQNAITNISPPPAYGQHTVEILSNALNFTSEEIKNLKLSEVIE